MKREDLEHYLENGSQLGFVKQTSSDDFLGWILLDKRRGNPRYEALLVPGEDTKFLLEQDDIRKKPYRVAVLELKRDVHQSDDYETNEDYRTNEQHYFASLDEVEMFVDRFGHSLGNIKWRIELDAP